MNEPCVALMGYVPGRYKEAAPQRRRHTGRHCRGCGKALVIGATAHDRRNSTCGDVMCQIEVRVQGARAAREAAA